ncbi:hypothetical protein HYFRA_00012139 [Hymenoscyphus fraxineus]|uniref:RNase H type-1 domain-containing protein n=1 Tax=Hymenoscyphus fraxineus TaxID=746836 RepID=A0A9N9L5L2_9HELO|nr:hypothetical protein HYFRA_00012139 [Hymenoscyphus fraxineus]
MTEISYVDRKFGESPDKKWVTKHSPEFALTTLAEACTDNDASECPLLICVDGKCKDSETPETAEQPENTEQPENAEKSDVAEKSENAEKPEKVEAVASYGIFFAPNSPYNDCSLLPPDEEQTSKSAELFAVLSAIYGILDEDQCPNSLPITSVVIQTESSYVFDALTTHIWTWQEHDYKDSEGVRVENYILITKIHHNISEAQAQHGITIKLRLVPTEQNEDAARLANIALEKQEHYFFGGSDYSQADVDWDYWKEYMADYIAGNAINRVVGRLSFPLPLERENKWLDSVISWYIRFNILLGEEPSYQIDTEALAMRLGSSWRQQVAVEKEKIKVEIGTFSELAVTLKPFLNCKEGVGCEAHEDCGEAFDDWLDCQRELVHLGSIYKLMRDEENLNAEPEQVDPAKVSEPEQVDTAKVPEPEQVDSAKVIKPEQVDSAKASEPEQVDSAKVSESDVVKQAD